MCNGFEIHGKKPAKSADERELSSAIHGEPRKEKKRNGSASESEGRWRAREEGRERLDDLRRPSNVATLLDGHARLRENSSRHTVRCAQQGEERVRD